MHINFTIPKAPWSLNTLLRKHWHERSKEQEVWDFHIYAQWLARGRFVFTKPVMITYIISFDEQRNRDYDNYLGGTKFITDAIKRTFITRDDSQWLKKIDVEFKEGKPQTEVFIEEIIDGTG